MANLGRHSLLGAHRGRAWPVRAASAARHGLLFRDPPRAPLPWGGSVRANCEALGAAARDCCRIRRLSVSFGRHLNLPEGRQRAWIVADDRAAVAADAEIPCREGGKANDQHDRSSRGDPPPAPADRCGRRALGETHRLADCVGHDTRLFAWKVALPVNRVRSLVSLMSEPMTSPALENDLKAA